ncbi:MAG: ABC transporter permease [Chloroflexi bacterium]|nr:ABC transporter permease [Chloroflexota bacterium]
MSGTGEASQPIGEPNEARRWAAALLIAALALLILVNLPRLSVTVWSGSLAAGLCFSLVALGVFITFRILDFPDLTIDGSFPLGAAVSAALIVVGVNPYLTLLAAIAAGALAGMVTAQIANSLKIHSLLASILTTTALLSVNLRVMGRSNIPLLDTPNIFTPFKEPFARALTAWGGENLLKIANNLLAILLVGLIAVLVKLLFDWFMLTELGLAMQATGANPQMVRALGNDTRRITLAGLALSNGLIALSGAIFAQYQGFADVNMGQGMIIAGLAAVIVGETIFRPNRLPVASLAVILGMILYRIAIAAALNIKFPLPGGDVFRVGAQDIKFVTAAIVLLALWVTSLQKRRQAA